jgi:hypothetical protein
MPDTTTKTRTPADELRAAARVLRCEHSFPCQPPHGSIARPGDCTKCGVTYDASEYVSDEHLAKQLVDLLGHMADEMDDGHAVEREHRLDDGRRRKYVHPSFHNENMAWTAALKIARSISGVSF